MMGQRIPRQARAVRQASLPDTIFRMSRWYGEDRGGYREPKAQEIGKFPCKAKNCEFDAFLSAETLEMHVQMRHGEVGP